MSNLHHLYRVLTSTLILNPWGGNLIGADNDFWSLKEIFLWIVPKKIYPNRDIEFSSQLLHSLMHQVFEHVGLSITASCSLLPIDFNFGKEDWSLSSMFIYLGNFCACTMLCFTLNLFQICTYWEDETCSALWTFLQDFNNLCCDALNKWNSKYIWGNITFLNKVKRGR